MPRRAIWGLRAAGLAERRCQPALPTAPPGLCLPGEHTGEGVSGCHANSAALLRNGRGRAKQRPANGSVAERKASLGVGVCFLSGRCWRCAGQMLMTGGDLVRSQEWTNALLRGAAAQPREEFLPHTEEPLQLCWPPTQTSPGRRQFQDPFLHY